MYALTLFFMNPHFFFKPTFFQSVGAAAGYDTCLFNEGLHALHDHDEVLNKFVQ